MPTGILKYKQDDGSIVELTPAGFVPQTTYNEGQAAQDTKITAAQTAANKANANIGNWETEHPEETISELAATHETEIIRQAGIVARLDKVAPDILPYMFDRISISSAIYSSISTSYAMAYIDLPWLHSQNHQLSARISGGSGFQIVNLRDGSVQSVDAGISVFADCNSSKPYHVNVGFKIPATIAANTPYLVVSPITFIIIE